MKINVDLLRDKNGANITIGSKVKEVLESGIIHEYDVRFGEYASPLGHTAYGFYLHGNRSGKDVSFSLNSVKASKLEVC